MSRVIKTRVVMNPDYPHNWGTGEGKGKLKKPVSEISDRAKRYRANRQDVRPGPPKQCNYCGSVRNLGVDHVNGNESDGGPENLLWACKACNTSKGLLFKRKGLGVITSQTNPAKRRGGGNRAAMMKAYGDAIKVMRGQFEGNIASAVATIRATPADIRSEYTSRSWPLRKQMYGASGRQTSFSDVPF